MSPLVKSLASIQLSDACLIGVENVSIITASQQMGDSGKAFGMVTTSEAYWYFLDANNLFDTLLGHVKNMRDRSLDKISEQCQKLILEGKIPYNLFRSLTKEYENMRKNIFVSDEWEMWGSIVSERHPNLVFGRDEKMHAKISDLESLMENTRSFYASLFRPASILQHVEMGCRLMDSAVSIRIQPMATQESNERLWQGLQEVKKMA
jgi:phosphoenolpyruvate synthase/pyruvate phosphate dikinase